jgi:pimeloyl-ACP methyl ester carboxylesterase
VLVYLEKKQDLILKKKHWKAHIESVLCRTLTMAKDALALMDHLGWNNTHVVGHSMGGMIACKLGAIAPERVVSLALISTTGGGYECLPKIDKTMISIAWRFLRAKTPEERAHVDLDTHYTKVRFVLV